MGGWVSGCYEGGWKGDVEGVGGWSVWGICDWSDGGEGERRWGVWSVMGLVVVWDSEEMAFAGRVMCRWLSCWIGCRIDWVCDCLGALW